MHSPDTQKGCSTMSCHTIPTLLRPATMSSFIQHTEAYESGMKNRREVMGDSVGSYDNQSPSLGN